MPADLSLRIQSLLDRLTNDGTYLGVQVAVYQHGELRIHAVSGLADRASAAPVTHDTLFPVFSVTKGIAATVIHRLVERGLLDYDQPIAHYWPEFAAHGKSDITLREGLCHASGLPQMPEGVALEDMENWDLMCEKIAGMTPLWLPGSRIDYHPITFGWIVGEPAVRVTGKPFHQLVEEEIRQPLGLPDLYMGLPPQVHNPIAVLEDDPAVFPPPVAPPPGTPESVPARFGPLSAIMNRPASQRSCIPATSGMFTAEATARHYAALLDHSLLSEKQFQLASTPQTLRRPSDEYPLDRGLGYGLNPSPSGSMTIGHGGHGGAQGFADPTHGLAIGLNRNRLSSDDSIQTIIREIYRLILG